MSVLCVGGLGRGVGPQVNKVEQVFSDDHQMSVAGGLGEGVCLGLVFAGGGTLPAPCDLPPSCGQTDTCENIAFPQLRLWTVKSSNKLMDSVYGDAEEAKFA